MSAVLFGSIGSVVETSEVQRASFNEAFQRHGLDWKWTRDQYQELLVHSGGRHRVEAYAKSVGQTVDAAAVHRTKSELFQQSIREGNMQPRPGVAALVREAKQRGIKIGLVTTTSRGNIDAMLCSIARSVDDQHFDVVVDITQVGQPKPSPDCYRFAISQLGQSADACIAIEDNVDGVSAAKAAGLICIAFPGSNTAQHDYKTADHCTNELSMDLIQQHWGAKATA